MSGLIGMWCSHCDTLRLFSLRLGKYECTFCGYPHGDTTPTQPDPDRDPLLPTYPPEDQPG